MTKRAVQDIGKLGGPHVIEGNGVTHLRYRVGAPESDTHRAEAIARQVTQAGRQ